MNLLLCAVVGYLIGGFPTGLLACRLIRGTDPRATGSGSTGAANVSRVLGKKWAAVVLLLDILKGFLPARLLAPVLSPTDVVAGTLALGAGLIIGHVWTPYAGFRGGKGVATAAGVMIALDGVSVAIGGAVWLLLFLPFRIVSVASLAAALSLPLAMLMLGGRPTAYVIASGVVAAFLLFTHRANLGRLLRREETRT